MASRVLPRVDLQRIAHRLGESGENHPRGLQKVREVQAEIGRVNGRLTRVCQVRKSAILPQTLTVKAGELTPPLTVK